MFNPLKSLGDLNQMRSQAQALQRELESENIEVVKGNIRVMMNAAMKVESVNIDGENNPALVSALNEAIGKAQNIAAGKLQSLTGGLSGLLK